ncbi:hypothetical protein BayCH28_10925 [Mycolicibacterium sp. CH28]|uniref:hypothetical protein n=1 Tax=Mycolicibacterium sp. CH28 TaxID=2512237 RepID=UPI0010800A92|nr:hypothetical protein [Mycolicibacterium sp. CH28]TGD88264.1 hypothetical protein BayCH28_10925 [Mycolicibacterium sp. CH28]
MVRALLAACAVLAMAMAALANTATAAADPTTAYMFGRCYDPSQPIEEQPQRVVYGCDSTSIMENMTWSSWGADGARGTGTDNSVECQPNCAQGRHLYNPIVVHAWNPVPADRPGCPGNVAFYSDFTVAYPAGVPPWVVPGTTWGSDVEYTYVDGMPAVHYLDQHPFSCTPLT